METIAELRKICQVTAQKDRSNIYMRYVCRFFSIYLTRLILPTGITANKVSFAMIVTGIVAALFFLLPSQATFLTGALLLQFWYLLDCMDGEVARYRYYQITGSIVIDKKEALLSGLYYDMINHYIINLLVPVTIGFALFQKTGAAVFILIGLAASLGQVLLLAMYDARCRTLLIHLKKYGVIKPVSSPAAAAEKKKRSLPHWVFMILHYTMTYPTVMNLVTFSAFLNLFTPVEWRIPLLGYLAIGSVLVSVVLIARTIAGQMIEKEFKESFQVSDETVFSS